MSMLTSPRTWVDISLTALRENWATIRSAIPSDCGVVAVMKADAYGHGAEACCAALRDSGATWFAVSSPAEGKRLRVVFPDGNILVLSYFEEGCQDVLDFRLIPQVWEPWQVDVLEAAWRDRGGRGRIPVHIELDTGMGRHGVRSAGELVRLLKHCREKPFLSIEGAMTHFSSSESLQPDNTIRQIEVFGVLLDLIIEQGVEIKYIHAGNSATAFVPRHIDALRGLGRRCGATLMIRPGTSFFGHAPRFLPSGIIAPPPLKPVLSWKTRVTSLREIEAGSTVGYDMTFKAQRSTRLALVPVGYADGLNRLLSNGGGAIVRGRRVPFAGRIMMDLALLDVTEQPTVSIGDEVALIGEQEGVSVSAYDVADTLGTIPDEVTCAIAASVPRLIRD